MTDTPERIWIDAWGGKWSPRGDGTQTHEYIRRDAAFDLPEVKALVEAATALSNDMLERAHIGADVIRGEEYRVVNAGNGAWTAFVAALDAIKAKP